MVSKNNQVKPLTSFSHKITLVTLGIICSVAILEVSLRLGGFVFTSLQRYRNYLSLKQSGTYRILCLGESTTAGQYPSFLEEVLNHSKIRIKFSVIDAGMISTTTYILDHLEAELDKYRPNMVIAMMGINDGGELLPCGPSRSSGIQNFLDNFRVYKLTRLLSLHISAKLREPVRPYDYPIAREEKTAYSSVPRANNLQEHIEAGESYLNRGDYFKAEEVFKKIIALDPRSSYAYTKLGIAYFFQGIYYDKAERALRKAIDLDPKNALAHRWLGYCLRDLERYDQAEQEFIKVLEIDSGSAADVYTEIAYIYRKDGKYEQAEKLLKDVLSLDPVRERAWFELGWLYYYQGTYPEAEKTFQAGLRANPKSELMLGSLTILCQETNERALAKAYYEQVSRSRLLSYNPVTCSNYLLLKEILDRRNIRFVCMQYPLRSILPLKRIFAHQQDIIFIENVEAFQVALRNGRYRDYFVDNFAGDFGHCTEKGNRLLAENIASVILEEVFGK